MDTSCIEINNILLGHGSDETLLSYEHVSEALNPHLSSASHTFTDMDGREPRAF